jgi:hypothetical protein
VQPNHPHPPKDNKEVNTHVKWLQSMLDAVMLVNLVYDQEDGDRGQGGDHQESPHGDSTSSITKQEERG